MFELTWSRRSRASLHPLRARRAPILLGMGLAFALCACGSKPQPQSPAATAAKPVAVVPPSVNTGGSTCEASPRWITDPSMPSEVAATESFCDFYQFSWQWFLAQVSPAIAANPSGDRVFETNRLYDPNIATGQCAMEAITGRANAIRLLAPRALKPRDVKSHAAEPSAIEPHDFEDEQADGSALYDRDGNILYYNIWYSQAECDSTPSGFAPGTLEIKAAWRVLTKPDRTYFTMRATLPGGTRPVTLGLVGFHLVNWTSKHPEMIWATFEHQNNAPLCDGSSVTPVSGWSFASTEAAQCLGTNPQTSPGPPSGACADFGFNTPGKFSGNTPPPTGTPNEVCRQYADGNQPGASVNGNDNAANRQAIEELNTALVGPQGLLTRLPAANPMAVWKHYRMVGALWTKNGAASGNPPVPSAQGPADPNSPQRGSLELTNMTMETFEQGDASFVPNCFGCHGYDPAKPLTVSHIEKALFSMPTPEKRAEK